MKIYCIFKKSTFELYGGDIGNAELQSYMESQELTEDAIKERHEKNKRTIALVRDSLKKKSIAAEFAYRAHIEKEKIQASDLVFSIGGDGTLLEAQHYITDSTPILHINSDFDPDHKNGSEGYWAGANEFDFEEVLEKILSNNAHLNKFTRLDLTLDDQLLEERMLNDLLIAHEIPGAMTAYRIDINGVQERYTNSGLLIGTPACSWIIQAGGAVLPTFEALFQFVAREDFTGKLSDTKQLQKGIVPEDMEVVVRSLERRAKLYIDGYHLCRDFAVGSILKIKISDKPLFLYEFNEKSRYRHYVGWQFVPPR